MTTPGNCRYAVLRRRAWRGRGFAQRWIAAEPHAAAPRSPGRSGRGNAPTGCDSWPGPASLRHAVPDTREARSPWTCVPSAWWRECLATTRRWPISVFSMCRALARPALWQRGDACRLASPMCRPAGRGAWAPSPISANGGIARLPYVVVAAAAAPGKGAGGCRPWLVDAERRVLPSTPHRIVARSAGGNPFDQCPRAPPTG
ncbi:hypothetical protein FQR65_LT20551 [Abscondita terminalis]|nr:hypothetical protein FQR65_LT20551 [Abscondita terminalis]